MSTDVTITMDVAVMMNVAMTTDVTSSDLDSKDQSVSNVKSADVRLATTVGRERHWSTSRNPSVTRTDGSTKIIQSSVIMTLPPNIVTDWHSCEFVT